MGEFITMSDLPPKESVKTNRMGEAILMSDLPSDLSTRKEVKAPIPGVIKNNRRLYEVLPDNSWKDRRCFIIGGGPSLRGFDFSQLKGELVIAVNRAFEKIDAPIMLSQDVRLWGWIESGKLGEESKRKFNEYKGLKVWIQTTWMQGGGFPFPEDVYTIKSAGSPAEARKMVFNSKNGLPSCTNSGLNALCLAVCLGANPIYLLGFDMKGEKGKAAWFHDGYPEVQNEEMYKRIMVPNFELFAGSIKKAGFKVINLNPDSELKCFEFGRFEDIKKVKRPLITGCYTKDTKYEDEIKRLEKSLIKFGLEYYFEGIENTGDWRKNCHQKVRFVQRCLEKFDCDIVQMDSDCEMLKFPELFEQLQEYDVGAHVTPSEDFRHKKEWHIAIDLHNVSVLYLKNNAKVKKLVEAWVKRDATLEDHIDDISFSKALKEFKKFEEIKVLRLPDRYCHIYDRPLKEEPVIELYQASRRLRNTVASNREKVNNTPSILQIEEEEKEKYSNLWKTNYIPSQSAIPLADYISQFNKNWKLLDIGCGNGITVGLLRKKGFNCFGVDITLDGIKDKEYFYEAPAWRLPFEDNEFDLTFSTDVLEHLPTHLVNKAIEEIFRITKIKTFHCIATFFVSTDVRGGVILHQTVKPIEWWREKFERLNTKKLDLKIIDRKDFLGKK